MDEENELIAKIFIIVFIVELIGILISYLIGSSTNGINFNAIISFTNDINSTSNIMVSSFNFTINCTKPNPTQIFNCLQPSTTPIAAQLVALANIGIYVLNILSKIVFLFVSLMAMVIILLLFLLYLLFIFIPSLFLNIGIIGYVLGFGYILMLGYMSFIFLKIAFKYISMAISILKGWI